MMTKRFKSPDHRLVDSLGTFALLVFATVNAEEGVWQGILLFHREIYASRFFRQGVGEILSFIRCLVRLPHSPCHIAANVFRRGPKLTVTALFILWPRFIAVYFLFTLYIIATALEGHVYHSVHFPSLLYMYH